MYTMLHTAEGRRKVSAVGSTGQVIAVCADVPLGHQLNWSSLVWYRYQKGILNP